MNKYILVVLLVFITACKSKAVYVAGKATNTLSSDKIIENHYNTKKDFSTLFELTNDMLKTFIVPTN